MPRTSMPSLMAFSTCNQHKEHPCPYNVHTYTFALPDAPALSTHYSRERSHTRHTTCLLHLRPKTAAMLQNSAHVLLVCAHATLHDALTCGMYVSKNFSRLSPVLSGMPVSVTYTGTCKLLKVLIPCISQNACVINDLLLCTYTFIDNANAHHTQLCDHSHLQHQSQLCKSGLHNLPVILLPSGLSEITAVAYVCPNIPSYTVALLFLRKKQIEDDRPWIMQKTSKQELA